MRIFKSYRKHYTRDIPITQGLTLEECIKKTDYRLFWERSAYVVIERGIDRVVFDSEDRGSVAQR